MSDPYIEAMVEAGARALPLMPHTPYCICDSCRRVRCNGTIMIDSLRSRMEKA